MKSLKHFVAAIFMTVISIPTWALTVPTELVGKTVTLVVPYPPGGGTDLMQRLVAKEAQQISGINFNVINKGGALGAIGGNFVTESAADGLTLLAHANENLVMLPLTNDINSAHINKLRPVSIHALTPQFFYTGFGNDIKNLDDLIKKAKANPKFSVGFSSLHVRLYMVDFFNRHGLAPQMIRYKSVPEMAIAAYQGDIDLFGGDAVGGLPHVKGERVRVIGTTWNKELSIYSGAVPVETTSKGFVHYNMQMVSAHKDTPEHLIKFYNELFREALKAPGAQTKWQELQISLKDLDVKQTQEFIAAEVGKYRDISKLVK